MSFYDKRSFTIALKVSPNAVLDSSMKESHTNLLPSAGIQTAIVRGTRAIRLVTSRRGDEQNRFGSMSGFLDIFNDVYNYATGTQNTVYMYQGTDGRFLSNYTKPVETTYIEITPVGHVSINYTPKKEVTKSQIESLPYATV
jgi:hypothetical protein